LEYPAGEPAGAEEEDDDGTVVEDEVVAQAEAGAACDRWVPRYVARGKEGGRYRDDSFGCFCLLLSGSS